MSFITFLSNYWYIIIVAIALIAVAAGLIYAFIKMPRDEQIKKVKEWLLYAVTVAEKELGGGTGQIKLRQVYDMFIGKFPDLVNKISFKFFSDLVDEALDKFRVMVDSNEKLNTYIQKE